MSYRVEMQYLGGWADAEWTETGPDDDVEHPLRFSTLELAHQAIDEFIADTVEAHKAGNLDAPYDRADFRAVPVT